MTFFVKLNAYKVTFCLFNAVLSMLLKANFSVHRLVTKRADIIFGFFGIGHSSIILVTCRNKINVHKCLQNKINKKIISEKYAYFCIKFGFSGSKADKVFAQSVDSR